MEQQKLDRASAWKATPTTAARARPRTKVEHRTYEEIVADSVEAGLTPISAGIGELIDLTGEKVGLLRRLDIVLLSKNALQLPSLASSLSISNVPVPTEEGASHLKELSHNVSFIVQSTRAELQALAREGKAVQEKRTWISGQERKASAAVHEEAQRGSSAFCTYLLY